MPGLKAKIMDETAVKRAVMRISHEITEKNKGVSGLVIVGIKRRGAVLAKMICDNIEKIEGIRVPFVALDISFYYDDLSPNEVSPVYRPEKNINVTGKTVIIVDDVLFTARTARTAVEAVFSMGRPKKIQLAVLIDRGHHELPISPDYCGKTIPTSRRETVAVCVPEFDNETSVLLYESL
ncbi:MAG: bifunctional pyr operon transcriptional regulator/uracil phosphoribosyltransferase PyrR [Clostridiales bacterium]|nr:bifunctional pyr operon transcriptional regulator/uracil phosphoribosyltransferase PyrR [Clostridiales bacterium]